MDCRLPTTHGAKDKRDILISEVQFMEMQRLLTKSRASNFGPHVSDKNFSKLTGRFLHFIISFYLFFEAVSCSLGWSQIL